MLRDRKALEARLDDLLDARRQRVGGRRASRKLIQTPPSYRTMRVFTTCVTRSMIRAGTPPLHSWRRRAKRRVWRVSPKSECASSDTEEEPSLPRRSFMPERRLPAVHRHVPVLARVRKTTWPRRRAAARPPHERARRRVPPSSRPLGPDRRSRPPPGDASRSPRTRPSARRASASAIRRARRSRAWPRWDRHERRAPARGDTGKPRRAPRPSGLGRRVLEQQAREGAKDRVRARVEARIHDEHHRAAQLRLERHLANEATPCRPSRALPRYTRLIRDRAARVRSLRFKSAMPSSRPTVLALST